MWVGLMAPGGLRFQDLSNVNINWFAVNLRHKFVYINCAVSFMRLLICHFMLQVIVSMTFLN